MAQIVTAETSPHTVGIPQNNGTFFDGTRYWVFYTEDEISAGDGYALKCQYGTSLSSMVVTNTNPGSPFYVGNINNAGRSYSILFGKVGSTWHAWAVVNQSDLITGKAFALFRWELTSGGLGARITATPATGDKANGHTYLTHNYGSEVVTNIYGTVQDAATSAAIRQNNTALSSDVGMNAVDSSVIIFPEHTLSMELSDGFLAITLDEGNTGEINGNYGHLREWVKTNVGDAWSSEATIEANVTGASANNGDFADQNYASNTSHAGQQDICQLDDGSIYVAYIDNDDLTNGDDGVIKLNYRGNTKASGWNNASTDLIGSSATAWHLCITTDGTDVWIFYVKDASGSRDTSIFYKKYDVSATSFGSETKLADMQGSQTFERMCSAWRSANGKIVVVWSENNGSSAYDVFADEVLTVNASLPASSQKRHLGLGLGL